jgi:hypothetical protein
MRHVNLTRSYRFQRRAREEGNAMRNAWSLMAGRMKSLSLQKSANPFEDQPVQHPKHPLGPLVSWPALEQPIFGRLYAAGILLIMAAILVTAARLHPDSHHFGTHEQLGLPPCGFLVMTGLPCPTCGMTTAFAHTVHGQFVQAIRAQIAGCILAMACAAAAAIALIAFISGRCLSINWYRIQPMAVLWSVTILFIAAWAANIVLGLVEGTFPYSGT